jgi:SAM-dependent methyltransferase
VLTRILGPSTARLLDEISIAPGMACLDAGCGGGDVSRDLARRVGPKGRVLGIDLDAVGLGIARQEAAEQNLDNVEFQAQDVRDLQGNARFDVVFARFLLSHLADPRAALACLVRALRPGGTLALEDVDFSGHFCSPECPAFREYVRLYSEVVRDKGADPDIGPRLPLLLREAGLRDVAMTVVQPAGNEEEVKLINPITMENIADTVVSSGLATPRQVARLIEELYAAARDDQTILSMPRIVQTWGRKG